MSGYVPTIGLEVHCELKTETKLFCSCRNKFGSEPNTNTCPVCAGHPGVLPVLNRKAVEYTVRAGCAIGCKISRYSKWDRKNYFYPDLYAVVGAVGPMSASQPERACSKSRFISVLALLARR